MALYQLIQSSAGILRTSDGAFIPADLRNRDYQAYQAWRALGNTPDPVPAATVDATTTLAAKIAVGIAITSTSTPALNATYALDEVSAGQIYQIGLYAAQMTTFPSGGTVQPYPDASGMPHNFSVPQFIAFLKAVAPLVSNLNSQAQIMAHGGTPVWPAQTAVII